MGGDLKATVFTLRFDGAGRAFAGSDGDGAVAVWRLRDAAG